MRSVKYDSISCIFWLENATVGTLGTMLQQLGILAGIVDSKLLLIAWAQNIFVYPTALWSRANAHIDTQAINNSKLFLFRGHP